MAFIQVSQNLTFLFGVFVGLLLYKILDHGYFFLVLNDFNLTAPEPNQSLCSIHNFDLDENSETCRDLIDCNMCEDVFEIDEIDIDNLTQELFIKHYDSSGRPVLIKNAVQHWQAMTKFNFEFFQDLYLTIQSPVLSNEDPDCEFLNWSPDFETLKVRTNFTFLCIILHQFGSLLGCFQYDQR